MFGIQGGGIDSNEPEHFVYHGHSLLCDPRFSNTVKELIDKYENWINLRSLSKPLGSVHVMLSWEAVAKIVEEDSYMWLLLIALGIITFEKKGNVQIFPKTNKGIFLAGYLNKTLYFSSVFHAKMCLVSVFASYTDRHLFKFDKDGNIEFHLHEDFVQ